eukprot:729204_1
MAQSNEVSGFLSDLAPNCDMEIGQILSDLPHKIQETMKKVLKQNELEEVSMHSRIFLEGVTSLITNDIMIQRLHDRIKHLQDRYHIDANIIAFMQFISDMQSNTHYDRNRKSQSQALREIHEMKISVVVIACWLTRYLNDLNMSQVIQTIKDIYTDNEYERWTPAFRNAFFFSTEQYQRK